MDSSESEPGAASGQDSLGGSPTPGRPGATAGSGSGLPTLPPPSGPPMSPSDPYPVDVLVGTVTAGGSGPCYGLETNDGKQYALYYEGGVVLAAGATIRVKVVPLELRIYCGPGIHMRVIHLDQLS